MLDCACGPGRHAVALAGQGFEVTGLDASPLMLERARRHAEESAVKVELVEARFETLSKALDGRFDAALCLGNSLSAVEGLETVETVLGELHEVLRPGGIAITQTVDFDVVAPDPVNPSPVRAAREDGVEYLFLKSFVRVDDRIFIHWVSLENRDGRWSSEVTFHPMFVLEPRVLLDAYARAGFRCKTFGDYEGRPYEPGRSRDLIVVAKRG